MTLEDAFDKWLDKDNPYGPWGMTQSRVDSEQHQSMNDAIFDLKFGFTAGWKMAKE